MSECERLIGRFSALGELKGLLAHTALSDADFMALLAVHHAGSASAGEIVSILGCSPATASRCLRRLVSLDLLVEAVDKSDRRRLVFKLANGGGNVVFDIERTLGRDRVAKAFELFTHAHRSARCARTTFGVPMTATEVSLVEMLFAAARPLRIGELAHACALSQPKTSMAVRSLERKGIVVTHALPDRRARAVKLVWNDAAFASLYQ